jgi:hypothetical protein
MKSIAIFHPILPLMLSAALPLMAGSMPGNDGKGGDVRALLREDSLLRKETARGEERREELARRWVGSMRLNEYGGDCVAYDPGAGACLLTVEAFNRSLEGAIPPARDSLPASPSHEEIEAARSALLGEILRERFLTGGSLPQAVRDSLIAAPESAWREQLRTARARLGDSALYALYQEHFDALFRGGEERLYQVLAGSDSVRIDSLWRDLGPRKPAAATGEKGKARLPSPAIAGPHWSNLRSQDLPPEALPGVGNLAPGAMTAPIRTPYGFLVIRLVSRRILQDTSFQKAIPTLIALAATRPKEEASAHAQETTDYFKAHRGEFFLPDTVRFRTWLLPENRPMRLSRRLEQDRMRGDTSGTPREVEERQLPPRLRRELAYYRPFRNGDLLGPIRSVFGTWYLRVLEVRKGRPCLTSEEAKPAILAALYGDRSGSAEAGAASIAEFQSKRDDARKARIADYLRDRDSGAMERWLREDLALRFVAPPMVASNRGGEREGRK